MIPNSEPVVDLRQALCEVYQDNPDMTHELGLDELTISPNCLQLSWTAKTRLRHPFFRPCCSAAMPQKLEWTKRR